MQTDFLIQSFFKTIQKIVWRDCEENTRLRWYYAEDNHYVVHDKLTNGFWFVPARSPAKACDYVTERLKRSEDGE